MSPIGSRHVACVNFLSKVLNRFLSEAMIVAVQNWDRPGKFSELQPDLSILKPREDYGQSRPPSSEDFYWLVEVTETSQHLDRDRKLPLYAQADIREVWLVDGVNEAVERYLVPSGERYRRIEKVEIGDEIAPQAFPEFHLSIKNILRKSN
ncbi:MAG: Uma2 family endonuclease [candidate division KSB1 bacterium]|nr:Uma2 family endonuclease [candidate division KSB1 bacterium]